MQARVEWFERYSLRLTSFRLPKTEKEQVELARTIGQDGMYLLTQVYTTPPEYIQKLLAVEILRRVWVQNFYQEEDRLQWREEKDCPPCQPRITSPYDEDARFSNKRSVFWNGYKVQVDEGYPSAELLVKSQKDFGVDLVGPVRPDVPLANT